MPGGTNGVDLINQPLRKWKEKSLEMVRGGGGVWREKRNMLNLQYSSWWVYEDHDDTVLALVSVTATTIRRAQPYPTNWTAQNLISLRHWIHNTSKIQSMIFAKVTVIDNVLDILKTHGSSLSTCTDIFTVIHIGPINLTTYKHNVNYKNIQNFTSVHNRLNISQLGGKNQTF